MNDFCYLIWSNYHRAWWRPNSGGYTTFLKCAGRYSREDALAICKSARDGWPLDGGPSEIPVVAADAEECLRFSVERLRATP